MMEEEYKTILDASENIVRKRQSYREDNVILAPVGYPKPKCGYSLFHLHIDRRIQRHSSYVFPAGGADQVRNLNLLVSCPRQQIGQNEEAILTCQSPRSIPFALLEVSLKA